MRFSKAFVLTVAIALSPVLAQAEGRTPGTYLGIGAGANFAQDTEISGGGVNADLEHDTGIAGILSLGHAYTNGLRAEFEVGYRRNSVDSSNGTSTGGVASSRSAMVNAYYDISTGTNFFPYIGAGIGASSLRVSANPTGVSSHSGRDTALALQGIAGVGYQFDRNWSGSLEYRYFTVQGADMTAANGTAVDVDYGAHTVIVGLRYTFGEAKKPMAEPAPAPAPKPVAVKKPEPKPAPPPPPPPVARNYIIFFDWDSSDITPEALAILRTAAQNAKSGGISRIEATGHADSSGTQAYNLKLSEKRARAVQAAMSGMGIAPNQLALDWKGELQQLVPTADGLREPQNRRVEIVFP